VTSYSTIGLSDSPILKDKRDLGIRAEFVGACASAFPEFANILATAAFCVINSHWLCHPGAIFPGVVEKHRPESPMRHLIFVPPFLWDESLQTLQLPDKKVAWLMAVPISESEYGYAIDHGPDALGDVLEQEGIDVFDLDRASILK
jgi:hypothetical protein